MSIPSLTISSLFSNSSALNSSFYFFKKILNIEKSMKGIKWIVLVKTTGTIVEM
jgi:hypothetical protein